MIFERNKGKFYVIERKLKNNRLIDGEIKIFNSMKRALDYGAIECPDLYIQNMEDSILVFAMKTNHKIFDYKTLDYN